jgi:hypothetical protein
MKIRKNIVLFGLIMAFSSPLESIAQETVTSASPKTDAQFIKENGRQPGPGENLPVSTGNGELGYITPEYVKDKKFWSDDAGLAIAALAFLGVLGGGFYFYSKAKK